MDGGAEEARAERDAAADELSGGGVSGDGGGSEGNDDDDDDASGGAVPQPGKPECYFIVHNVAKKHNVGTLARCATAFGIKSVCLIGSKSRACHGIFFSLTSAS